MPFKRSCGFPARACALMLALLLFASGALAEPGTLEVAFLNAGKADAFVLLTENSAVVIDTGENSMGDALVDFLLERGVSRVDALFITHFDKDHVGGADALLAALPVSAVYESACEKDNKQTRQYREALEDQGLTPIALQENMALEIDGVQYAISVTNLLCTGKNASNDSSLVIRVQHGQTRFLFAGDAENDRLAELLREGGLACDVLKSAAPRQLRIAQQRIFSGCLPYLRRDHQRRGAPRGRNRPAHSFFPGHDGLPHPPGRCLLPVRRGNAGIFPGFSLNS